jgi:hypothetical protein
MTTPQTPPDTGGEHIAGAGECPVCNAAPGVPCRVVRNASTVVGLGDVMTGFHKERVPTPAAPSTEVASGGEAGYLIERVAEVMREDGGCWHSCSGCQESVDGCVSYKDYPFSEIFQCQPGAGCGECGGIGVLWQDGEFLSSYADMLDEPEEPSALSPASAVPPIASSGQDLREGWADSAADEWAGAHYDNLPPSQQQQWHVFRAGFLCAASEVNAMELALLADADQMLADFREGDPGKNIQTLVPTPEWKEITKAANRRGVSLSLFLRLAARQHLVWLKNYRSPDALLSAPAVQPGGDLVDARENLRIDPLGLIELAEQCSRSDCASAIELGEYTLAMAVDIPAAKLRARKAITDRYYAGGKVVQMTPVKPAELVDLVFDASMPNLLQSLSPSHSGETGEVERRMVALIQKIAAADPRGGIMYPDEVAGEWEAEARSIAAALTPNDGGRDDV